MAFKESVIAAMEELTKRSKVTLDDGNQRIINKPPILSKEETNFYKLMFGDDIAAVRYRKLHCTACDIHIGSAPSRSCDMFSHPVLLTLLCGSCRHFYGDGNFEQGEDATDMFCRWCANGGSLYCCSYCSNTFCNKCIKRNFDPLIRKKIEDEEKWKCFVCDPTDLYTARAVCRALLQHVKTVTRILESDRTISKEDFKEKMNLDESKCCSRKRNSKGKRRKLSTNESEEDETYHPSVEDMALSLLKRSMAKKSPRLSAMANGQREKSNSNRKIQILPKPEVDGFDDEDDDLPPPMIPCVQYMVEGESSETLNETINKPITVDPAACQPTLHINPIPTANLLKATPPPLLTPIRNNSAKRKRTFQHILPAPPQKFVVVKNTPPHSLPASNVRTIEYSSLSPRPQTSQPNTATVSNSNTAVAKSPASRLHAIEYSSLPLRAPSIQPSRYKQTPRVMVQKPKAASTSVKDVGVIEIGSDSDELEIEESVSNDKRDNSVCKNRDILKNMLNKSLQDSSKFPESCMRKRGDKSYNKVEDEIDLRTEEVRMLFKMISTKLKRVPLLHLPNHNNLRSTRVKTRRFHLAINKAISTLSEINDKVVHKYSNWRKSMLEESRRTRSNDSTGVETTSETISDITIPLEMICTNSESESDNDDDVESNSMLIGDKVKCIKSFQERDTIDVGVGEPISTADKSIQAFDVVDRDYEKCIGHSVLTKVEYDPVDGSEILKPVIVPAEFNGKFEEQFIFYLQHREESEVETDDDKGLPDPNETPLKDLIEANSPFVLEMLESIDSPLENGMITNELEVEASDESGKENEGQSEPTNVVKELAKMVTELSEDLKTSRNTETLAKKHSEHGKKDRRKQILEGMESGEVDIAVQALIEDDERSRSSSNDDENISRNAKQFKPIDVKKTAIGYIEDDCTIIE